MFFNETVVKKKKKKTLKINTYTRETIQVKCNCKHFS